MRLIKFTDQILPKMMLTTNKNERMCP